MELLPQLTYCEAAFLLLVAPLSEAQSECAGSWVLNAHFVPDGFPAETQWWLENAWGGYETLTLALG